MSKGIQAAISELNENINDFVKCNENKYEEMKMNLEKPDNRIPLSKNLNGDAYKKTNFSDYIRNGCEHFLKKSLSDKNGESGGYLVPKETSVKIDERLKFLSPMRAISHIITISTNSIEMLVDSKKPNAGWATSADENRNETDSPEIKKIKIPVHEIFAKPKVSQRLLDDSQIDIEEWLIKKIAEKIAALENNAFVNGDGKDKPLGFLKCESEDAEKRDFGKLQHFYTGAIGAFKDNDTTVNVLIDMVCSLRPIYVKNAKWIMSRSVLAEIRKLKNKDDAYLWQPALSEASPSMLLGYPVIIDDDMPTLTQEMKSISVAFGDFYSGYQIVDRQGLKILRDPYTSKPFVEFYATKRVGGRVVDFDAIKLLKFAEKQL
ncbi:MAG: phage major capsid protein [Holosporaceae bacterium]|jgi:HK97 family phage major capsid protein|nr:phage major capsid protein [Holosporaceae bacterium]